MKTDMFYDEPSEQSRVKATIVAKYFDAWARVMVATQKRGGREDRIAYIDLFAGPGGYRDGTQSTPLMVLEKALQNPELCDRLVTVFNDADRKHSDSLRKAIDGVPEIGKLRHPPPGQ